MDTESSESELRGWREYQTNQHLPPIPRRALPPMPSPDHKDEMPLPKTRRKKATKKESHDVEDLDEPGMELEGSVSRRQSESRDPVTPEAQDVPPQKKKKRKKVQTPDPEQEGSNVQSGLENGEGTDQQTDFEAVPRKAKKKKKSKVMESQYSDEITIDEDDVIAEGPPTFPQHALFSAPIGICQPVSKVFVEGKRGFQATGHIDQARHGHQFGEYIDMRALWTTRDVALKVHSGFRVIGLFSHGFLAGYAVWNIIVVYVLAGEQLTTLTNLLRQYSTLAYPSQSLLYMLLAISTVSAFDRINLAKASIALKGFLTMDPAALASLLYFAALILSLSQQMTSDRINLYSSSNGTLWPAGSEQRFLPPWIVVNLVVALLVGLAWVFVTIRPELDYTEEFLRTMELDEPLRQEEKPEMPA